MELRRSDLGKHPLWHSNQGWRARIAIIYPGGGYHHIADFHKLAPKGVALGAAAVPRHRDDSVEAMMSLDEKVVDTAKMLAASHPDVIGWFCTAGSFLKGRGRNEQLIREMEVTTGVRCTTTSAAMMAAFRQLGIRKLAMCTPYPLPVNDIERDFLESNGFKVVKCDGLDIKDNDIITHLSPTVLYRLATSVNTADAEGVFISCTGLDALDVIEALEQDLGKPIVTSNQASFWMAFRMAGVGEAIPGYGRLMREPLSASGARAENR